MKRLILLAALLLPASAFAQPVSPFPPGVTPPIFGLATAVDGGGTFPAQLFGPQSCTVPAYAFTGATTTGYGMASSTPCVVVGGTQRLGISSTSVTSTVPYLAPDGSASAPSYSFANSTNAGFYRAGTNEIKAAVNGADLWEWNTGGISMKATGTVGWSSTSNPGAGDDVSLSRGAADVLQLAAGDAFKVGTGGSFGGTSVVGTLITNDDQSIANAAIISLGTTSTPLGKLDVFIIGNENAFCTFSLRGATGSVSEVTDPTGSCTIVKDSASSLNVYWSGTQYELQNLLGGTRTIKLVRTGR